MKAVLRSLVVSFAVVVAAGCSHEGGSVAVIDLTAIASATGQDKVIQLKAETARNELQGQLQQLAQNLDQQLAAEAEKMGENPTPEQQQLLQQINIQARTQLAQAQQQAQGQANQIEQNLITEFTESISPLAEEIAQAKGVKVILAEDSYLFWFDSSVDITDEVIAAWRARPEEEVISEAAVEEAGEEAAEAQAQLEEVTEELAETEEELVEAEAQIEVLEEVIEDVLEEEAASTE